VLWALDGILGLQLATWIQRGLAAVLCVAPFDAAETVWRCGIRRGSDLVNAAEKPFKGRSCRARLNSSVF